MSGERPTFDTRAEAEAYCRAREAEEADASWLAFQSDDGQWTVVRTSLPRPEDPLGTATEAKPKPSPADDPRTAHERNVPWPGAP
jgi:hypothetical protein